MDSRITDGMTDEQRTMEQFVKDNPLYVRHAINRAARWLRNQNGRHKFPPSHMRDKLKIALPLLSTV
jgi:hypothetical protein